jgi:anti-sigma factor RsiW
LKHDDLDKRVSAFIDGALRGPKREQLQRELERDSRLAKQVDRSRALGRLVREAWNEGPVAPAPDFLLASIRPALAEIDRERNARPVWQRGFDAFFARFAVSLRPSPAFATAAAVAFVAALTLLPRFDTNGLIGANLTFTRAPLGTSVPALTSAVRPSGMLFAPTETVDFGSDGRSSVIDASPGHPAVLWRDNDGSQTLWLLDQGGLSFLFDSDEGWG